MKTVFLTFLFITTSLLGGVVNDGLKRIPLYDKLLIKEFVRFNLQWNQTLHVFFFDNKPISLATVCLPSSDGHIRNLLWLRGFEAFRKYEHLFPHPNFMFILDIYENDESGPETINLFIINKRALAKCFDQYACVFRERLGDQQSFEWFVSELERKQSLSEIIKEDQVLLGLLLGFGKDAAIAFQKHSDQHYVMCDFVNPNVYCGNSPKMPEGCQIAPVVFMGNPYSTEVQNLMSVYEQEMNIYWNVHRNKDPLVLFLNSICEESGAVLEDTFKKHRNSMTEFSFHVLVNPYCISYKPVLD